MGDKKEYIERGELLKTPPFTKYGGCLSDAYTEGYLDCAEDGRMAVKCSPAADVVEVVRCEKCKFFFEDCCNHPENRIAYRVPDFGDHYVYAGRIKCEPDHFCGRGERKEQT